MHVDRRAVFEIGHVFDRKDLGDNTLVAMSTSELVANADLALLRYVDPNQLVHARRKLVAVIAAEDTNVGDLALLAVRNLEARVTDFAGLLTEDCTKQSFFGVSSVSPFGVTLPTSTSPGFTSAPTRMMPRSSRSARISSLRFGISRVISSGPSLVSRASISCSWMWIESARRP